MNVNVAQTTRRPSLNSKTTIAGIFTIFVAAFQAWQTKDLASLINGVGAGVGLIFAADE